MVLSSGKILREAGIVADGMRKCCSASSSDQQGGLPPHPPALRHTVRLRGCVGQSSVKRGGTAGLRWLRTPGRSPTPEWTSRAPAGAAGRRGFGPHGRQRSPGRETKTRRLETGRTRRRLPANQGAANPNSARCHFRPTGCLSRKHRR